MTVALQLDDRLLEFEPTDTQRRYFEAVKLHGSASSAARTLNVDKGTICRSIQALRKKAAARGFSPDHGMERAVPEPFVVKGHSTLDRVDRATGERTMLLQWTKSDLDRQAYLDAIKEGVQAFIEGVGPVPVAPPMPDRDTDVIPWIQIGDGHLGMLAHEAETGENFDLKIAERELCAAISILIDEMGEHDQVVINDLGDFTHYENTKAETEASGHRLDADGRFPRMIRTYSRIMRFIVEKALTKANTVHVIVNQGNHSRTNDIWMAELLRVAYGYLEGRVNVLNNDSVFIGFRMGNTLVMTHHSDKCPAAKLIDVMATDFREDFGETEYHYIDTGHIHHNMRTKEYAGASIESWNTLAAKDKWATDGGYRSRQSISIVDRSRTYGEVGRRVLPIRRVRDVIFAAMERQAGAALYRPKPARAFAA